MPQIDPKFTFYFGVWTNLLMFIAGYGVDHAPAVIQQYAPSVQWVVGMLGQANGVILTALVGISSTKAGPLVMPSVKPVIILALAVVGLLALGDDAHAQGKPRLTGDPVADIRSAINPNAPPRLTGNAVNDLLGALDVKLLPDLQYAKALADASGSKVTAPCYQAWIDIINTRQSAGKNADGTAIAMPDPHIVTDFEKMVELRNALQPDSDFMIKCSPVASMVKKDIAGFIGVVVSGGAGLATLVPGL